MIDSTDQITSSDLVASTLTSKLGDLAISDSSQKELSSTSSTTNAETQTLRKLPDGPKEWDPFQFGSRFLTPEMTGFEFNAWDHVETDDEFKKYAEQQYAFHRDHPVADFDKKRFNDNPDKWWDLFYKNNKENFFKDRKWLQQEFPILSSALKPTSPPTRLLEVGCGAGNTMFPLLSANQNQNFHIHGSDFSKTSIALIEDQPLYKSHHPNHVSASVWDLGNDSDTLPPGVEENSIDIVILIFVFSALHPNQWQHAVRNITRCLKKGGKVLFRDYGRGDLAQVRFKKGRFLEENFYVRGDGTRVYFFEEDELRGIFQDSFQILNIGVDRRMLVNRARKLKMYRCWIQGLFVMGDKHDVDETVRVVDAQGELPVWMQKKD